MARLRRLGDHASEEAGAAGDQSEAAVRETAGTIEEAVRLRFEAAEAASDSLPPATRGYLVALYVGEQQDRSLILDTLPTGTRLVLEEIGAMAADGLTVLGLDVARLAAVAEGLFASCEDLLDAVVSSERARSLA
jgi:hypothetical protein